MKVRSTLVALVVLVVAAVGAMAAPPMDLAHREARWVTVRVMTTSPGALHPRLSPPAHAWYEAGPGAHERLVTVPGSEVERVFFAGRRPVAGTFSDLVWRFDASTGHVDEASFSGVVREQIRIGPLHASAQVSIAVRLSTRMSGGYRSPRRLVGRTVIDYCADPDRSDCMAVPNATYDPASGWVRANGAVCASWRSLRTLAYTPMGHARFGEREPDGGPEGPGPQRKRAPLSSVSRVAKPRC